MKCFLFVVLSCNLETSKHISSVSCALTVNLSLSDEKGNAYKCVYWKQCASQFRVTVGAQENEIGSCKHATRYNINRSISRERERSC